LSSTKTRPAKSRPFHVAEIFSPRLYNLRRPVKNTT